MENVMKTKRKSPAHIAWLKKKNVTKKNKWRSQAENTKQRHASESAYDPLPGESFRDMDICPSTEELLGTATAPVRRNLVDGAYRDAEDYLDLQFRLLREDFVRPLREGLAEVRARDADASDSDDTTPHVRHLGNGMKVYREVRFAKLVRDYRELTVLVKIDVDQINLANDKLFMYGSLLCFSPTEDNFKSVILAKVTNCYPSLLRKGFIMVALINRDEILDISFGASYSMVESEVFFEPYYRVLTALQTMALDKYPMCNYVLGKVTTIKQINQMRFSDDDNPGLNATQLAAYRMALTNNLTLIQGPPGTGKTYLGLKVVQRMIALNEELEAAGGERPPPILVICATNHALDQFLEHVVAFNTDVVRVGGQSQSEALFDYMMAAKRKLYRKVNKEVVRLMQEIELVMNKLRMEIEKKLKRLNSAKLSMDEQTELEDKILALADEFYEQSLEHQGCKLEQDLVVLQDARLVGMTTTSAARLRPLLDNLGPSIMIVEEAAEVLEGHIVGALTKHCRHVVLIGDHQQLRPITSCYKLSKEYRLDISLFERLCKNRVPFTTLNTQHRMRPEFAQLLVPTIYRQLFHDATVQNRPSVRGVERNLFFVTHFKPEEAAGWSRKNVHEAEFLMALCRYLILQGYAPEKITIIAMYAAQVTELERLRAKEVALNGVVISSVDGYQGEENDIVLLSLVRSNEKAQIGFLWTVNRVCVALSRARFGLYIIGNMENLTRDKRSVWWHIDKAMTHKQTVGTHLPLRCAVHGTLVPVSCADDFAAAAGACGLGCADKPRPAGSLESLLDDRHMQSAVYTNGNLAKSASMQNILDAIELRAGKSTPGNGNVKPAAIVAKSAPSQPNVKAAPKVNGVHKPPAAGQGLPNANGKQKPTGKPVSHVPPTKVKHIFSADFEPEPPLKPHAAVKPFRAERLSEESEYEASCLPVKPLTNGTGANHIYPKLPASDKSSEVDLRSSIQREMDEFDRETMLKRKELLARVLEKAEEPDKRSQHLKAVEYLKAHLRKLEDERHEPKAEFPAETLSVAPMTADEYLREYLRKLNEEKRRLPKVEVKVVSTGSRQEIRPTPSAPPIEDRVRTGAIPRTRLVDEELLPSRPQALQRPVAAASVPQRLVASMSVPQRQVVPTPVPRSYVSPTSTQSTQERPTQIQPPLAVPTPAMARPLGVTQANQPADTRVRVEFGREALHIGEHRRQWPQAPPPVVEKKKKKSTCAVM